MIRIITQDKDFFPVPLREKFWYAKKMGFDGMEVDGGLLLNRFEELQQAVAASGLPVVSACGGYAGWIGDFKEERREQAIADISNILLRLSSLQATGIVIPAAWGMFSLRLPPMVPPRSSAEDEAVLLDSLGRLNRVAAGVGVRVFLEPLNRYEDHMINTLSKAAYYIRKGGFSHVSVIADFYHMNIEEAQIDQSLLQHAALIGHIHLADSHRYQPGSGHIDFKSGFRALHRMGYEGAMAFECRVLGPDAAKAYGDSLHFIKDLYQKMGM